LEIFLDGGDLDIEEGDIGEDQYISDFNMEDKKEPEVGDSLV